MKTKALISFVVTAKLICVFVFAYAKSRFSHDAAHLSPSIEEVCIRTGKRLRECPFDSYGDEGEASRQLDRYL